VRAYRRSVVAAALSAAAIAALSGRAAVADNCAPIVKAELATVTAPGFRQYMSVSRATGDKAERLLSIALGDTVYIAIGGPSGWQKMDRKSVITMAREGAYDSTFRDCKSLGTEPIGGAPAAVYQFTMASKSQSFPTSHAKVWIGEDGLLRKQATDKASLRYEYDNVQAPVP